MGSDGSREAAKECSPQRKLWVYGVYEKPAPVGRKKFGLFVEHL
jgi:hypothetical protein